MYKYDIKYKVSFKDIKAIKKLEEVCQAYSPVALKLELDYRAAQLLSKDEDIQVIEAYCYHKGQLVGYLGAISFGHEPEVTGMVHPDYRRQGIFTQLYQRLSQALYYRHHDEWLLLCDRQSQAGQALIKSRQMQLHHSEFGMVLNQSVFIRKDLTKGSLDLVAATNQNTDEITQQNAEYFDMPLEEVVELVPDRERKFDRHIYLAKVNDQVVGKVHLELSDKKAGIFGLGIKKAYRSKGYGRALLVESVNQLRAWQMDTIYLQVEAQNHHALKLYIDLGFEIDETMDYYLDHI